MECRYCHTTPPAHNTYGVDLVAALDRQRPFADALPAALDAVAQLDSDGDGHTNRAEIAAGTWAGEADSFPRATGCPAPKPAGGLDVCAYDAEYVFSKVRLDVCGVAPTQAERQAFAAEPDPRAAIHRALEACLDSAFWLGRDGVLWRLAHRKILPLAALKSGEGAGALPVSDYDDDYALFVYTQSDDRDAREVLTADYFVASTGPTSYAPFDRSPIEDLLERGPLRAQLVEKPHRAGLLTHRWPITAITMGTGITRTTAAHFYRAHLRLDIAKLEGLSPVPGEPVDYDDKDVDRAECAVCHSTLDPLAYPFSVYGAVAAEVRPPGLTRSLYQPDRLSHYGPIDGPDVTRTPEAGALFGQRVANVVEWAQVAANSDAFARATVTDYWIYFFGESPRPSEQATFDALWRAFRGTHQYRVEAMLHDLVDTEAYGVP